MWVTVQCSICLTEVEVAAFPDLNFRLVPCRTCIEKEVKKRIAVIVAEFSKQMKEKTSELITSLVTGKKKEEG